MRSQKSDHRYSGTAIRALLLLFLLRNVFAVDQTTPGWYAFNFPSLNNSAAPIDMSFLNSTPAGADGHIRIENGHFVDPAGHRARFLGTNVTFGAALPPKSTAPLVAAHLKRLGFNLIRFHHIDSNASPNGILKSDHQTFDWNMVDRMEYFINELQKCGIYINMNLHVGRYYPGMPTLPSRFKYGKVLDHFYQPYIEMEKSYAQTLLTHRNPYNNKTLAEDPAVLIVEITNEDSIFQASISELNALPDPFRSSLLTQWHEWLAATYASDEAMRAAWSSGLEAPGPELITNGGFESDLVNWTLEKRAPAVISSTVEPGTGPDGSKAFKGAITTAGTVSYAFQLHQTGLNLVNGRSYTMNFDARSPSSNSVIVAAKLNVSPWSVVGLNETITLPTSWRHYEYTFEVNGAQTNANRISFNFGGDLGEWWIDNVSLKSGHPSSIFDLLNSYTRDNAPIPTGTTTAKQLSDFKLFLYDTECATLTEIRDYLKNTLQVKSFICNTQAMYGGLASIYRESGLTDFVDAHSYWQHPSWTGEDAWDPIDWKIGNTPLSSSGNAGTMKTLYQHRVWGKPYTVSEYNHPAPSFYSSELFPILSTFGSFQDWDAIYQFTYKNDDNAWDQTTIDGYFTLDGHPVQLAFVPFAAMAFRTGCFTTNQEAAELRIPDDDRQFLANNTQWDIASWWGNKGASNPLPILAPCGITRVAGLSAPTLKWPSNISPSQTSNPASPITWQMGTNGVYKAVSDRAVALLGEIAGNTTPKTVGPFEITFQPTSTGTATFAAFSYDGQPLASSRKILIALANRNENTNMVWNEDFTSVNNHWGTAPQVVEGITATIRCSTRTASSVFALDGTGNVKATLTKTPVTGGFTFSISPSDKTLWFLLQDTSETGVDSAAWEQME